MLVKDQLRVRMDQLGIRVSELARRVGVSSQSVRHWLTGRSFPGKAKTNLIEEALTFKLDFTEGNSSQTETIEQKLEQTDLSARIAISKLSPRMQVLIAKMAEEVLILQDDARSARMELDVARHEAQLGRNAPVVEKPSAKSVAPSPPNHGRVAANKLTRKTVA